MCREPRRGRVAQRRAALDGCGRSPSARSSRRGRRRRRRRSRPSSTSSTAALSGPRHDDARRPRRRRLDDDEPVALATRRQHEAERRGERLLDPLRRHEARHVDRRRSRPASATTPRAPRRRSGPSPKISQRRSGIRSRARGDRRDERRHALLRDVAAGEDDRRRLARLDEPAGRPGVLTAQHGQLAAEAELAQPPLVQAREAERPLRDPKAQPLHQPARPRRRRGRGTRASRPRVHTSCQSTTRR